MPTDAARPPSPPCAWQIQTPTAQARWGPHPHRPRHGCRATNAPPHQHPGQEPTSGLLKFGPCKQSHSPVVPTPQVDGEQGTHHTGCMGSRAGRLVVCSCPGRPEMEVAGRPEVRPREWPVVGEPPEGQTDLVGEVEVRSRNLWTDRRQTQTRCSHSSAARTTCIHCSCPACSPGNDPTGQTATSQWPGRVSGAAFQAQGPRRMGSVGVHEQRPALSY